MKHDKLFTIERADEARADPSLDVLAGAPSVVELSSVSRLVVDVDVVVVAGAERLCVAPFTTIKPAEASNDTVVPSMTMKPPRVRVDPSMTKPDAWLAV